MSSHDFKDLISHNQWETLFAALKQTTTNNEHWQSQVTQLESRYRHLKQQSIKGILTPDDENRETNRLRESALSLINDLPDGAIAPPVSFLSPQRLKMGVILIGAIAVLANVTTILDWLGLKPNSDDGKPFSIVVNTHGRGGYQDILQLKDTKLVIDIGGRRILTEIGKDGQNTFNEIPPSFYGKKVGIGINGKEGYVLTYPDSTYLLNGEPIYVGISLGEQTRTIIGNVNDQNGVGLKGVTIATLGESVLTDATGYFKLKIPIEKQQQESYTLSLIKKGYKSVSKTYIPLSQPAEYRLEKN